MPLPVSIEYNKNKKMTPVMKNDEVSISYKKEEY